MRILAEFRPALRSRAGAPGVVALAVASLALGIGPNATVFNFVNAIEFRPGSLPEPERLVDVSETNPQAFCHGCAVGSSWPAVARVGPESNPLHALGPEKEEMA
jgi:hypothetical protein